MDPRLMRKRVRANDRLVRLHRESGQVRHESAGRGQLLCLHLNVVRLELPWSGAQCHHDLFERGVAGALAESVDGHLYLARTGLHCRQRIGGGKTQVVVAVDADRGVASNAIHHELRQCGVLRRNGVADRVRDVDR